MSDKAVYEPLSGVPLPPVSRKRREINNQEPNYDTEPTPDLYQDETVYSYEKYMKSEYPRPGGTRSPSNSSQVDIISTFADSTSHQTYEEIQLQSATGFGAGLVCLSGETLLGYPFLILRRQCQLNVGCRARDLSPLLMLKAVWQIQSRQGGAALWKGFTCHLMLEGIQLSSEACISHVTGLPKELPSISEGPGRLIGYTTLKTLSTVLTLPVLSAVLLETVQSESARADIATPMSCLKEAVLRIFGRGSGYHHRHLLPMHQLILPTLVYTLCWDLISNVVHSGVLKVYRMRQDRQGKLQAKNTLMDSVWPELLAGTLHCFVADITLLPLEIIMNRLHLQGSRAIVDNVLDARHVFPYLSSYSTAQQCIEALVDEEGVASLWKGLSAVVLQYTLRITVVQTARLALKYFRPQPKEHNDSLSVHVEQ